MYLLEVELGPKEQYSALERKEVLTPATTRMNPEAVGYRR